MPITVEEGKAFAAKSLASFAEGFPENNHAETCRDLFAEKVSWTWSDGNVGEGPKQDIFDIMAKTWGFMVDDFAMSSPKVVVDTDYSKVAIQGDLALKITGGLPDESHMVMNPVTWIYTLNAEKKAVHWIGIWNNKSPSMANAMGKVMTKLGMDAPTPAPSPMPITQEEGESIAKKLMAAFVAGFPNNNHAETNEGLIADKLSWDWSDGVSYIHVWLSWSDVVRRSCLWLLRFLTLIFVRFLLLINQTKGEGTSEEVFGIFSKSWGFMCDSVTVSSMNIVVDTDNSVISVAAPVVGNITGGFADETNIFHNDLQFVFHLNEDKKVIKWFGYWDNQNPGVNAAVGRVMARLEGKTPITVEEGKAYAEKMMTGFAAGFSKNDHAETVGNLVAETLEWDWSDGTKGTGSKATLFDIFSKSWGFLCDTFIQINPHIVVDTDYSVITVAGPVVVNLTGGLPDESNIVRNDIEMVFHLNQDKKCVKWVGIWNNQHPDILAAVGKVMSKLGMDVPPPAVSPMPITLEEGKAYADKVIAAFIDGFATNNHMETFEPLIADELAWDWSDGTKGSGTKAEILGTFSRSWGFMCDSVVFPKSNVIVDTDNSVISVAAPAVGNITGGFADENNPFHNDLQFHFHLNEDKKCVKWECYWDNKNPKILAPLGRVMARLEAASTKEVPTGTIPKPVEVTVQ